MLMVLKELYGELFVAFDFRMNRVGHFVEVVGDVVFDAVVLLIRVKTTFTVNHHLDTVVFFLLYSGVECASVDLILGLDGGCF
jgi:hypothetical protein